MNPVQIKSTLSSISMLSKYLLQFKSHHHHHHHHLHSKRQDLNFIKTKTPSLNHHHSLQKRSSNSFHGKATFFDPGLGACGWTNSKDDFIVALNQAQYTQEKWCGKKISITFGRKTHTAQITDECPGCPFGGLDMSPALFKIFADEDVGVFYMNWKLAEGDDSQTKPDPPPPSPKPKIDPPPIIQPDPPKLPSKPDPPKLPSKPEPPKLPSKPEPPKLPSKPEPPKLDDLDIKPDLPKVDVDIDYKQTEKIIDPPPSYSKKKSNDIPQFKITSSNLPETKPTSNQPSVITGISTSSFNSNSNSPIQATSITSFTNQAQSSNGNLDAINQLVIAYGSLTAASAGHVFDDQST
ncbi:hypothetical protein O181_018690 [Austropuccinia psidii MF-1]|uniref:RlpA-like protein double-psi beta-barrel domain-containing protein n=1 Tax=Austropuccinia psidii MF-1 TaxID=1389203 RepID=A0A9Q3GUA3_9BASI|nr:hypothetical protein [Austropuccinia psidii MF-1]